MDFFKTIYWLVILTKKVRQRTAKSENVMRRFILLEDVTL